MLKLRQQLVVRERLLLASAARRRECRLERMHAVVQHLALSMQRLQLRQRCLLSNPSLRGRLTSAGQRAASAAKLRLQVGHGGCSAAGQLVSAALKAVSACLLLRGSRARILQLAQHGRVASLGSADQLLGSDKLRLAGAQLLLDSLVARLKLGSLGNHQLLRGGCGGRNLAQLRQRRLRGVQPLLQLLPRLSVGVGGRAMRGQRSLRLVQDLPHLCSFLHCSQAVALQVCDCGAVLRNLGAQLLRLSLRPLERLLRGHQLGVQLVDGERNGALRLCFSAAAHLGILSHQCV